MWLALSARGHTSPPLPEPPSAAVRTLFTESLPVRAGDNLAGLLARAGLDQQCVAKALEAIGGAFDVRKLRAGTHLSLGRSEEGRLETISYLIDRDHQLELSRPGDEFSAAVVEVPSVTRTVTVRGTLKSSLYESMERTGERAELALQMAEIFGWSLDFYTDPCDGDEFSLLVEKREYSNGQPPAYLSILAATYNNTGKLYDAYLFPASDGKPAYYSHDGNALRSAFLRSPFKYEARISSHFSQRRRHPILKIVRPHLGTDYAAPAGTPVQSIGSGVVVAAGWSGQGGNMVKIRHANGYETMYLHLSRMLVRAGERVEQGQRIGLVGATGLATGPHLDFRMTRSGKFVNFARLQLPPAAKLAPEQAASFAAVRDRYVAQMQEYPASSRPVMASTGAAGTARLAY
ncbi:MAG TPA: peptidoglycan DD-metalloendopeptidase family protein [Bryobacteraceae bacterium]|nr:peptidoglycan DD-metalloendopeptidase family protein [Bryobacteraceae bacterium]